MSYGPVLARLRKEKGYTQIEVADYISRFSEKPYSFKMVSHWENDVSSPPLEQFLLLCELYAVKDIQSTFRGVGAEYRNLSKLNALGKSRAEEYIAMLSDNPIFSENESACAEMPRRYVRLYDIPVAAGAGSFLDSDAYEESTGKIEVWKTMTTKTINGRIVVVNRDTPIISDGQTALEFAVNIGYEHDCRDIAINKAAIAEGFFTLSNGIAGEIVQKFVNYGYRLAIIGDFSIYTSKALRDYIYECNKGGHLYFVADEDEAVAKLGEEG